MKITKIDGISHKKYKEKGKLIKSNEIEKDITEERFNDIEAKTTELFQKTLDFYVKNYENSEDQNKERREKAKNYFSKVKILVDNKKITICNENTEKILLVKMHNGNWGFPKGHIENNETKEETAIREVHEETNVNIKIIPNFEREIKYIPNEKTIKKVTIFAGITQDEDVKIDTFEIEAFQWCTYEEALKLVTYKLQKDVLEKARKVFVKSKTG